MKKKHLNLVLFGSEKPAGVVKLTYLSFLVMLSLCVHGIWVDVVPVDWLTGPAGFGIALVIGFVVAASLFAAGQINGTVQIPDNPASAGIVVIGAVALLGAMAYPVVTKSLPWAHAAVFGHADRIEAQMRTEGSFKKRACDHRLTGGPLTVFMGEHLCTSRAFHQRYPNQKLWVRLHGQRSALGFRIVRFEVIEAPRPGSG